MAHANVQNYLSIWNARFDGSVGLNGLTLGALIGFEHCDFYADVIGSDRGISESGEIRMEKCKFHGFIDLSRFESIRLGGSQVLVNEEMPVSRAQLPAGWTLDDDWPPGSWTSIHRESDKDR